MIFPAVVPSLLGPGFGKSCCSNFSCSQSMVLEGP